MTEVAGTVNDRRGQPYPGALVVFSLTRNNSVVRSDTVRTRQDGSFAFQISSGIDDMVVSVRAGARKIESAVDLRLSGAGSPIANITFTLPDSAGSSGLD
jgi:hypothetical protein